MKISRLIIQNFKSIRKMSISDIENALILVGKNNTGKTIVLDAIRLLGGEYEATAGDHGRPEQNIVIEADIRFEDEDYAYLHERGIVSKYRRYDAWQKDFTSKLPALKENLLSFKLTVNQSGRVRYSDGIKKHNPYIRAVVPKIFYIDNRRHLAAIEEDLLMFQDNDELKRLKANHCLFDVKHQCRHCFQCMGVINKKTPQELSVIESARLMEYKLYTMNLSNFAERVNKYFQKNGGYPETIVYRTGLDVSRLAAIEGVTYNRERDTYIPLSMLGQGMRSIYILSLLEAYIDEKSKNSSIILMEDPEIFLHPQLQKVAGEVLYRLSKKNQVIFSTHSPNMLFNFTRKQIRQIILDEDYYSVAREPEDVDQILDDLGYTANDLMNVSFVFIVEGRQDKSRLPLLLKKYYSELTDPEGNLSRVAIITTNSCTNIKTYANLKYINKLYFKDQFLMIRDSDGKDPEQLIQKLCRYYDDRGAQDIDKLPRVRRCNVLILKYYSFENYFLNPEIMTMIGVVESPQAFYQTLFEKWQEYLYRLASGQQFTAVTNAVIEKPEDLIPHMEAFKTYVRGHNLYDIFYGRFRAREEEVLTRYIELAGREEFADILDTIDQFIYFESRKKSEEQHV